MPLNEDETKRIISRLKDLPTLPQVVARIMQIVSNPMTSAADLNEVIAVDQALTAKVLRLANSAYYGFPKEITTIPQAVVILGFNTIRNLALSVSVHKMLFEGKERTHFSPREFWKHSVGTAVASKLLAKRIGFKAEENAFTAGLLHDIGKNFFEQHTPEYNAVLDTALLGEEPLWKVERAQLGLDHAQVGAWMAEKWNLPPTWRPPSCATTSPARSLSIRSWSALCTRPTPFACAKASAPAATRPKRSLSPR
jgi:putative nucleotidyltransferase with HDIG domain